MSLAITSLLIFLLHKIKYFILLNQSTTIRIESFKFEFKIYIIKSINIKNLVLLGIRSKWKILYC